MGPFVLISYGTRLSLISERAGHNNSFSQDSRYILKTHKQLSNLLDHCVCLMDMAIKDYAAFIHLLFNIKSRYILWMKKHDQFSFLYRRQIKCLYSSEQTRTFHCITVTGTYGCLERRLFSRCLESNFLLRSYYTLHNKLQLLYF